MSTKKKKTKSKSAASTKKASGVSVQRSSTRKAAKPSDVPSTNVLDLRSAVAKRQAEKAQAEKTSAVKSAKQKLKQVREEVKAEKVSAKKLGKKSGRKKAKKQTKKKASTNTKNSKASAKKKAEKPKTTTGDEFLLALEDTDLTDSPLVVSESEESGEAEFWAAEMGGDGAHLQTARQMRREERRREKEERRIARAQEKQQRREDKQAAKVHASTSKLLKKSGNPVAQTDETKKATTSSKRKTATRTKSKKKSNASYWDRPLKEGRKKKRPDSLLRPILVSTAGFAAVALVFVLPATVSATLNSTGNLQTRVTVSAEEAFKLLQAAADSAQAMNFEDAEQQFASAQEAFDRAQADVNQINGLLAWAAQYVPGKGKTFHTGKNLIAAGDEFAQAGELISAAAAEIQQIDLAAAAQSEEIGVTGLLVLLHSAVEPVSQHVNAAAEYMAEVDVSVVPEDRRDLVVQVQELLPTVQGLANESVDNIELLLQFLGHDESRRYLVLFQNNHEMRPTGGFPGSIALIDISRGVVTNLDVPGGGIYDVAGQFTEQVVSPSPLHLINPHWNIQDANWFPHFPTSAQKIQWFYERSKGPSVDGIITLVPSVIEKFFAVTDLEVDLEEEHDVVITADNFYEEVQVRAEQKYEETRESKAIIGDITESLFNTVFSAVEDPQQLLLLAQVLRDALTEKDILVYMNDADLQAQFSERDWTGELKQSDRDYLSVIHANIAGGKTDGQIEEVVRHTADIHEDGRITDTVTITRVHKGEEGNELSGVINTSYTRFYVPEGATLISAEGFQAPDPGKFTQPDSDYVIDEDYRSISGKILVDEVTGIATNNEFGKTVFGGWITTEPGKSSTVTIEYELPFTITTGQLWNHSDRYSLLVQKQPGSFGNFLVSDVRLPANMKMAQTHPPGYDGSVQQLLSGDYFAGMVIEPQ